MNKRESYKIVRNILEKHAAVGNDIARGMASFMGLPILTGMVSPEVAATAGTVQALAPLGGIANGLASKVPTIEEVQSMDDNANRAFIPGVTTSRFLRRRRALRKLLRDKPEMLNLPISEVSGQIVSPIAGSLLGGLVGGENGAAIGGSLGFGGDALGALAALFTDRRSLADQAKVENSKSRALLRHIVPGLAAYDYWKGIGATRNLSDRDPEAIRAEVDAIRAKRNGLTTNPRENEQSALQAMDL